MTNASQPRIAVLRCLALQRPARAAKFIDCIWLRSLEMGLLGVV